MNTLDRKLIRELGETKGQSLAIGVVIASGVAVFVMALNTLGFLTETRDAYFDRYRFADVFASVSRAPLPLVERIAEIPGVAEVQTRIVSNVTLDVPGLAEPAVGHLVSLPDDNQPTLNQLYLRRGRLPEPDREGEVLISDAFFEANQLELGDSIDAILNGRLQPLTIVGVALSPEFVLQVQAGEMLPDDQRYGIFWMAQRQLEAAFDMDGAFNDVTLRLLRGANEKDVIDRLDRILKPYGAPGAYGREFQLSARFLSDEIRGLKATGMVAPSIFMAVAAFLVNVVLSRRIATHRTIIAALKAFGYTNSEIAIHYLKSALIVAALGSILGVLMGQWMATNLTAMYAEFYRFPTFIYRPDWRIMLLATLISLMSAMIGSLRPVLSAVALMPAAAMRPAAPAIYRRTLLELLGLTRLIPVAGRMIMRGLQRRPISAIFSSIGIAFSVAVLLVSSFIDDAIGHVIEFQYSLAERQDIQVSFVENTTPAARHELRHLSGVQRVEPYRVVPVDLRSGHRDYRTSILGLDQQRDLYRLLNTDAHPVPLPNSGVVISDILGDLLQVTIGDLLTVEVLDGAKPTHVVPIVGVAAEFSGANAYMDRNYLNRLLRETDSISGAYLAVDAAQQDELYSQLKRMPQVASVAVKQAQIQKFRETIQENQNVMQSFTAFFAAVIAIGVVYNTARISLDERSRELATLRVIGMTRGEVSTILLGELALLTAVAIPIGWAIGYGLCFAMAEGFSSETIRIPVVLRQESLARSALITTIAAAISGLIVRHSLDKLDLVEVLKSNE
jgi:putative ABC transport system permease protein